jgi:hypothetical protein
VETITRKHGPGGDVTAFDDTVGGLVPAPRRRGCCRTQSAAPSRTQRNSGLGRSGADPQVTLGVDV